MADPVESIRKAALDMAIASVPRQIVAFDEPHSEEAQAIGELLAKRPPWWAMDSYSVEGWAGFAEAVLRAQAAIREKEQG